VTGFQPLFRTGETSVTARLILTVARTPDIDSMAWLEQALSPEWQLDDLLADVETDEAVLISRDGLAIGIAVALPGALEADAACVPLIAIAPPQRFRGLGGEAALAIEARILDRWGCAQVLAPVPEGRGLAVYFWLRLGYAPLIRSLAPWPLVGLNGRSVPGIWMGRDVGLEDR